MPRKRPTGSPAVVHRTARVALRVTDAQRRRCFELLRSGGDVWAWLIDVNAARREVGAASIFNYQELCRELSNCGPGRFGELSSTGARSILRRYSDSAISTAKRRKEGDLSARYPRRKKALVPSRYYAGTFSIEGRRLRLPVARSSAPLSLRLTREVPYPPSQVRSVTLVSEGSRLFVDVTAEIEVPGVSDPTIPGRPRVAGVDLGIIHPFAVVSQSGALLVSGRALRAESRLHLAEHKARRRAVAKRAPGKGQRGSRRWRQYRRHSAASEARHRRRLAQARHEAAKAVVEFALAEGIDTLVVGDPRGVLSRDSGVRQNLATRNWRVGKSIATLSDKAQLAGIEVVLVDERGTSSTCPRCHSVVPKPRGRSFTCPNCQLQAHRDLVGAANIAARSPRAGITVDPSGLTTMHRRAGRNLPGRTRRDPRRVAMDHHRRAFGPWPAVARPDETLVGESLIEVAA